MVASVVGVKGDMPEPVAASEAFEQRRFGQCEGNIGLIANDNSILGEN